MTSGDTAPICSLRRLQVVFPHLQVYRKPRTAANRRRLQNRELLVLAESERSICLITSICAEDGSTRTDYSCMMASTRSVTVDTDAIIRNILVIRGQRVLLDSDLAALYQVATKALTRAVRRNPGRFPADFMFQLAVEESASLRSQSGALKTGRGKHRKYAPYFSRNRGSPCCPLSLQVNARPSKHRDHEGVYSPATGSLNAPRF